MSVKKSSFVLKVIALFLTCFLLIFSVEFVLFSSTAFSASLPKPTHVIVIDAGHGGIDGGVTGSVTGAIESDINLEIAKKLYGVFKSAGFEVVMTRTSSAGLYGHTGAGHKMRDMKAREKIIKDSVPSLFISIHQNKFSSSSRRGGQVFYKMGSSTSFSLAKCVQEQINALKDNGRKSSPLAGDYYLLNVASCPSVIVECGFLSNPQDERLLISESYQKELANAIYYGCMQYLTTE
ncbi:MAG: N-acetylmuramoyl-L-alanine amidase [Clostridia bacterium]|nr:N-acetylmuramoyl-L-alanine amidase [Clostridia bacterium]